MPEFEDRADITCTVNASLRHLGGKLKRAVFGITPSRNGIATAKGLTDRACATRDFKHLVEYLDAPVVFCPPFPIL